jgi:hypothetical protein
MRFPDAAPPADGRMATVQSHDLGSCTVFPAYDGQFDNSYWNADISSTTTFPNDPNSDTYISSIGKGTNLHPDFGSDPTYGIPYDTVPGTQAKLNIDFFGASDESDPGPYPFPWDAPIEAPSDSHVLVIDRDNCVLYEAGNCSYDPSTNSWSAYSGAIFDLKTTGPLRPDTWTSADAAGLPIFAGLVRYEEVTAGTINHAIRFTASTTQDKFSHPATHQAGNSGASLPPMGLRVRMKSSSCTTYLNDSAIGPESKVIVQAMCTYGMMLADNGSDWYFQGSTDPRWDDNDLDYLKGLTGNDFEAVQLDTLR